MRADGRCGRFPRCWCRFLRCRPSSSPASPGSTDSEGIDGPAGVSPGEGGGIVSRRHPSPGGRAGSPWSASRARIRGLSIVLGSPSPSAGSSPGSGRRGPTCRRSRRSGGNGTHVQKWCHVLPPKDCNPMESINEPWWCRYAATAQAKGTWAHCHGASASKRAGTGGHVPSLRMSTSHRPARAQR